MRALGFTRCLGCAVLTTTLAATTLNGIFAGGLAGTAAPYAAQYLLCIALAFNIVSAVYTAFFAHISIRKISKTAYEWSKQFKWRMLAIGVVASVLASIMTVLVLIWLVVELPRLPATLIQQPSETLLIVWFALWGSSVVLQVLLYNFIGVWIRRDLRAASMERLDLDFGIQMPPTEQIRPPTRDTHISSYSQDPTLASPPRTPNRASSSVRHSTSTKVGPGSSRTRLIGKHSANSSFDYPAGEAVSIDSAFDSWDTSSVHREIRAALHQSPPVTRSGLETIPGSRPDSPADALDGPFLPESPNAATSPKVAALDWIPSSPPDASSLTATTTSAHHAVSLDSSPRATEPATSSPPSSPPNFSRPTSRSQHRPALETAKPELIHPLFRPGSPRPPPIAVLGTMVTASPLAGQSITPRTLARMRSNTLPQHWKAMPSPEKTSNAGSAPGSPGLGSPGPSIADEETLPPILPGFVLSAGQRSSYLGYGKRKSVKDRPKSTISEGSGRSMSMI